MTSLENLEIARKLYDQFNEHDFQRRNVYINIHTV